MISLAHRIVLTEACNRNCPHCFNADQRDGKHMDIEKLFNFWMVNQDWLRQSELKIMGGEPTVHPGFLSVIDLALKMFRCITVFTNGSNLSLITHPDMLAGHWGDKIQFVINAFTFDVNIWKQSGKYYKKVAFHFVLGEKETIEKAAFMAKIIAPVQAHFMLSGDTQINILDDRYLFEYRVRYVESLIKIISTLRRYGHTYSFDHVFPQCFWTQEMIETLHSHDIDPVHLMRQSCCDTVLGLLDTNFDLWYCNQTRLKIGNVYDGDKPRPMDEIHQMLQKMPDEKCEVLTGKCVNCPARITCKSACWFKHAY